MNAVWPLFGNGGMGVGISNRFLAAAVALLGGKGTVSVVAKEQCLLESLLFGTPPTDLDEILKDFPYPPLLAEFWDIVARLRQQNRPSWMGLKWSPIWDQHEPNLITVEHDVSVCAIIAAYVECRGTGLIAGPHACITANLMWKVQLPFLAYLFGILLSGVVTGVEVGAGIPPSEMEQVIQDLCNGKPVTRSAEVGAAPGAILEGPYSLVFRPEEFIPLSEFSPLPVPVFIPIIGSNVLATKLRRSLAAARGMTDKEYVHIVYAEKPEVAGGHVQNARQQDPESVHISTFGPKDVIDLTKLPGPYFLGGNCFHPEGFANRPKGCVTNVGGTPFAFCSDSGLLRELRHAGLKIIVDQEITVHAQRGVSSSLLPFRVADIPGTFSDELKRLINGEEPTLFRGCSVGVLSEIILMPDGSLGQRCSGGPLSQYDQLGGTDPLARFRSCLCRSLSAGAGHPQVHRGVADTPIVTSGEGEETFAFIRQLVAQHGYDYTAADVIHAVGF